MVQAYSSDLRSRVIKAATDGMSARQAAERFGVGVSTAIVWVRRYRQSGEAVARTQGKPRGSRLDAHAGFILGLVEAGTKDISLAEIVEHLANERGLTDMTHITAEASIGICRFSSMKSRAHSGSRRA